MEIIKTEKKLKEVDEVVESYSLCDKCNKKIDIDRYDSFQCELKCRTGNIYPEGGGGDQQKMELCQSCAKNIIEFLKESGYRIIESKWDC